MKLSKLLIFSLMAFNFAMAAENPVFKDFTKIDEPAPKNDPFRNRSICKFENGLNETQGFPCGPQQCEAFNQYKRSSTRDLMIEVSCQSGIESQIDKYFGDQLKCTYKSCPAKDELVGFFSQASCEHRCHVLFNRAACDTKTGAAFAKSSESYKCVQDFAYKDQFRPSVKWWKCVIDVPSQNCVTQKTGETKVSSDKQSDNVTEPGNAVKRIGKQTSGGKSVVK